MKWRCAVKNNTKNGVYLIATFKLKNVIAIKEVHNFTVINCFTGIIFQTNSGALTVPIDTPYCCG